MAGYPGELPGVPTFDERGQHVFADAARTSRLVDDEHAAGGVRLANDVLNRQGTEPP